MLTEEQKTAFRAWVKACGDNSRSKGFRRAPSDPDARVDYVLSKLMLVVGEVAEAQEDVRDPRKELAGRYCELGGELLPYNDQTRGVEVSDGKLLKPVGFGTELADILIRVADLADEFDVDLVEEVDRKMRYNATRPHRHGGKRA